MEVMNLRTWHLEPEHNSNSYLIVFNLYNYLNTRYKDQFNNLPFRTTLNNTQVIKNCTESIYIYGFLFLLLPILMFMQLEINKILSQVEPLARSASYCKHQEQSPSVWAT